MYRAWIHFPLTPTLTTILNAQFQTLKGSSFSISYYILCESGLHAGCMVAKHQNFHLAILKSEVHEWNGRVKMCLKWMIGAQSTACYTRSTDPDWLCYPDIGFVWETVYFNFQRLLLKWYSCKCLQILDTHIVKFWSLACPVGQTRLTSSSFYPSSVLCEKFCIEERSDTFILYGFKLVVYTHCFI